ncbi:MAG: hypothetical protein NTZ95_07185 [Candidatus Omnitrophica bacterium]|nr:hypothetical protein [Candidatus Omnitrophota bacterium]
MKISPYQIVAVLGSSLLMLSGLLRFFSFGNPKELIIGVLYFFANLIIFCS